MIEVRRESDGELCGYVHTDDRCWRSFTVFGAALAEHPSHGDAEAHVLEHGLAVLAELWWYRPHADAEWQIACIVEARPGAVRLALDYYPMPGVAMVTVTAEDLAQGVGLTRSVD
jgi:hypothetical protein